MSVPIIFADLPAGQFPASFFDRNFAYLLGLVNSIGGVLPRVETGAGPFVILPTDRALVLNKLVASPTTLFLPTVFGRNGVPLAIADWGGNAGDLTLTPSGVEKIMGGLGAVLGSGPQGFGTGASVTLYPSETLVGWYTV